MALRNRELHARNDDDDAYRHMSCMPETTTTMPTGTFVPRRANSVIVGFKDVPCFVVQILGDRSLKDVTCQHFSLAVKRRLNYSQMHFLGPLLMAWSVSQSVQCLDSGSYFQSLE